MSLFRATLNIVTMNNTLVVVGAQWGDEGKGKITDFYAGGADVVVRHQGDRKSVV